jgi:hypothetical protein
MFAPELIFIAVGVAIIGLGAYLGSKFKDAPEQEAQLNGVSRAVNAIDQMEDVGDVADVG